MAVFTKINSNDIKKIEKIFNLGKIKKVDGIKKGIENTNYLIKFNNKKFVLTIFEKRVKVKDLPFFMKLMSGLASLNINCPKPMKTKKNSYLFNIRNKKACLVSFLKGNDKKNLTPKDCYVLGKNIAILHKATNKLNLSRKNSLDVKSWSQLNNKIDKRINKLSKNLKNVIGKNISNIRKNWPKNLPRRSAEGACMLAITVNALSPPAKEPNKATEISSNPFAAAASSMAVSAAA